MICRTIRPRFSSGSSCGWASTLKITGIFGAACGLRPGPRRIAGGRMHDFRMKRPGDRQGNGLHRADFRGHFGRPQTGAVRARYDENVGSQQIGDLQDLSLPGLLAEGLHLHRSRPMSVTMPPAVASAASCIAAPASEPSADPSSYSMMPAKTKAVYSPRLNPAAASHESTTSGDWSATIPARPGW